MVIKNEFFLVDAKTYATFKECQKKIKELQQRIEELLKYKPLPHSVELSHKNSDPESETLINDDSKGDENVMDKDGGGKDLASEADNFERRCIEIFNKLSKSGSQIGSGALDLTPQLPGTNEEDPSANLVPKEPLPSTSAGNDDDGDFSTDPEFSDTDDDNELTDIETHSESHDKQSGHELNENVLNDIPKSQHLKAKELFNALKQHTDDVGVGDDGTLILYKNPIPDSNFFQVFPLLFRSRKFSANIPYFKDFVNEIASLGLGHLISRDHTSGYNPRGKNQFKDRSVIRNQVRNNPRWYYLGL